MVINTFERDVAQGVFVKIREYSFSVEENDKKHFKTKDCTTYQVMDGNSRILFLYQCNQS